MDSEAKGAGEQGRGGRRAPDSLDGALDALQGILERRRAAAGTGGGTSARRPPGATEPSTDVEDLPVLEDVVIPGPAVGPLPPSPAPTPAAGSRPLPPWDDLVRRLTSEAEVIIEECLQDAIGRARKEIKARIKLHLDIVLPEILDEIRARDDRR